MMKKDSTSIPPAVLTAQIQQENESLHEQIRVFLRQQEQLTGQITELTKALSQRDRMIEAQRRQLEEFIRRFYGRSSEKLDQNQLLLGDIILDADKNKTAGESQPAPAAEVPIAAHTRRQRRGRIPFPEHLRRVNHYLDIEDNEKQCPHCKGNLNTIGEDVTERLEYQPSSLFINRYIRPKYACGNCTCDGCGVRQHEAPAGPIDKCGAESGLLAHIITEKYEHHNPLYRQELRFERKGVPISRQTMAGWMERCAEVLLPLYVKMREEILKYDIVLNDDTPVSMQDPGSGKLHKSYLWVTVGGEDLQYRVYDFTYGRGREGPQEFFSGYHGYFVSDAYGGYDGLFEDGSIKNVACWAHARRYFLKAMDSSPAAASEILTMIARLYRVEKKIKHLDNHKRLNIRQSESNSILGEIETWLKDNLAKHLPESPIRKAIAYTLGIWKELCVYTEDGRLPIDNNLAEQAIRPIALGRKNWLFFGSENGGRTGAVLLSFCATCRKMRINTWQYLRDILSQINDYPASKISELLPDRWKESREKN